MRAKLEFDLEVPEDKDSYKMYNQATAMHSVIWNYDQWLRNQLKHASHEMPAAAYEAMERCREKLGEIMDDEGVVHE